MGFWVVFEGQEVLTSRIPCREEIDTSGKETSFKDAEENAETEESGPVWDETECLDTCYELTFWGGEGKGE